MSGCTAKLLILCLTLAVVEMLPTWGNQSDDAIAQLQLQLQAMNQRLERLEGEVKFLRPPGDQPTQTGQAGVGGVNHEQPKPTNQNARNYGFGSPGIPEADDSQDPINERVVNLENAAKVLTEGIF